MRIVILLAHVLLTARPAAACYPAFSRAIVGAPTFEPADAVTVTSELVDVTCDERFACTVTSTFGVAVRRRARVTVTGSHTTKLVLAAGSRLPAQSIEIEPADTQMILTARAGVATACYRSSRPAVSDCDCNAAI